MSVHLSGIYLIVQITARATPNPLKQSIHDGLCLVVDTGATSHIINDSRLIDPKLHKSYVVKISTGTSPCYSVSKGPATLVLRDADGNAHSITREVIYCPTFKVNLFSPGEDFRLHGTRVDFNDALTLRFKIGFTIPFTE